MHLPNSEKVLVTHIGIVQVTSTLILEDEICVPAFTFNLISVNKLTKSFQSDFSKQINQVLVMLFVLGFEFVMLANHDKT